MAPAASVEIGGVRALRLLAGLPVLCCCASVFWAGQPPSEWNCLNCYIWLSGLSGWPVWCRRSAGGHQFVTTTTIRRPTEMLLLAALPVPSAPSIQQLSCNNTRAAFARRCRAQAGRRFIPVCRLAHVSSVSRPGRRI